jgi:hypothetical protein
MGWWNTTIYGGDAPLDWRENIYNKLGIEEYGEKDKLNPVPVKVLSEKIDEIMEMISNSQTDEDDKNIGYQVLGAIIIHSGLDLESNQNLKDVIISAIENDEYARDDSERRIVMKNFKKQINEYNPSEPVDITAVNVYEAIEEDDILSKEFKQIFSLMKARMKKLERGKDEKSGVEEYDKGFSDASDEEIDFLTDFMELMSKMEMMGVLFEKIAEGISGTESSTPSPTFGSGNKAMNSSGGGKDIMPG